MAETVCLDLVTPEGSPEPADPQKEDVPVPDPVDPQKEDDPVPQVAEGGPGASKSLVVGIQIVQASDWSPKEDLKPGQLPAFQNAKYWTTQTLGKPVKGSQEKVVDPREFVISVWDEAQGVKPIKKLFPRIACDVRVLAVFAHSAPYHPKDCSHGKADPRQYLSLGDNEETYVPLKGIADVLNSQTSKIRDKYDVIFLGCCQGDKLAALIKKAVRRVGLIIFFGADEEERDGAAGGLICEVWEEFLEKCREYISNQEEPNWKDVFERTYLETGQSYLAPKGEEGRRVPGPDQDFEFMDCIMDRSVVQAMKDPSFVEHYTFAGDLHAFMDGVDLVTDELKTRRKAFMAEKQAEVDREHAGAGAARGKRRHS